MSNNLGQYFTESLLLQSTIFSLCSNKTSCLEPSSGAGHLVKYFEDLGTKNIVSVEVDDTVEVISENKPIYSDFFDYSLTNKFDTIFGNPPFVRYRNINDYLKLKLNRSALRNCNLFYYFIEKAFYHLNTNGELIFVVPKEFLNSTRAKKLRTLLFNNGTITDVYDFGGNKFFKDASLDFIIFRYQKDNFSHTTNFFNFSKRKETLHNTSLLFLSDSSEDKKILNEYFDIKVGLVTGANKIYMEYDFDTHYYIDVLCSDYIYSQKKHKILYLEDVKDIDDLKITDTMLYYYMWEHKQYLINRGIKKFSQSNWYKYGAVRNLELMTKDTSVIYVNQKTRKESPFFIEKASYFDGSMLALFPKDNLIDLEYWCDLLNNNKDNFIEQGMYSSGRYLFSVKTLSDLLI